MKKKTSIVMKWYRLERWCYTHKLRIFGKILYHLIQILFGCSIPPEVKMGKGVDIAHFHGIVLHHNTVIGENTIIYQNVTVGGRNGKVGITIGKDCVIGAGACLLGNITLGDRVNVGANAVVLTDVPDDCTVVGIPGKIIQRKKTEHGND